MDDWYPIFVTSAGRWVFVCWCPWQNVRNWILARLKSQGWNAAAFYTPNAFQRNPQRPPYPAPRARAGYEPLPGPRTDWQRVSWVYQPGSVQLLAYTGSPEMAAWLGRQLTADGGSVEYQSVTGSDNLPGG